MEELGSDIEEDQQVQRNPMDPGNLADQIIVRRPVSTRPPETSEQLSPEDFGSLQLQVEEESIGGLVTGNLLEDAKFYQDVAVQLQTAYDTLQKRFDQQSRLMEESSGVLRAVESQASRKQRELFEVQRDYEANVQQAIGEVVMEYHEQLAVAKKDQQLKDHEHQ